MKTKQIIIVIAILLIGILIGKFAFSNGEKTTVKANSHQGETLEEHWTCSMHPQIDLPEAGQCPICGMDLILKESNNSDDDTPVNAFKMSKNAMALANIETLNVGDVSMGKDVEPLLKISGKIETNDKQTAVQTAHIGGRIEYLKFKSQGEYVAKGALVAKVYSPELVTAQNELLQAVEIKNSQPELYKAVRNKLKNWKISEKQIRKIEQTHKAITNFNMYANVAGYVVKVLVEEGNHVKEGAVLFTVANLSNVWASFDVYEKDIQYIKSGQKLQIRLNAYPDKTIQSRIDFVDPILNMKTRTLSVRATLSNNKGLLKPGMLLTGEVKVKAKIKDQATPVQVPKSAVLWTGKRSIVYVKTSKDEPVFEMREVVLGNDMGDSYQINSGLVAGEEVVVNGTFTVDATAQIQGKRSMMNHMGKSHKDQHSDMDMGSDKSKEVTNSRATSNLKKDKTEMKCGAGKCGGDMKYK